MIHPNAPDTLAGKLTVRSVFVIGPDKKIKLSLTYPASTGRSDIDRLSWISWLSCIKTEFCGELQSFDLGITVPLIDSRSQFQWNLACLGFSAAHFGKTSSNPSQLGCGTRCRDSSICFQWRSNREISWIPCSQALFTLDSPSLVNDIRNVTSGV